MDEPGIRGPVQEIPPPPAAAAGAAWQTTVVFAMAMTAQIAQASLACRSESWSERALAAGCAGAVRLMADCDRGRRMRDAVEMPKRQHKLDRQRQQREPRALFDVRSGTTSCRRAPQRIAEIRPPDVIL